VRVFKLLLLGSCILLFTLTPGARASAWDQKVITTFSGPVEIPGQILPTGTYVFKVLNVTGTRDIVQVTNADETKVLTTAFTVARYRPTPTSKAVFVMEERGVDSPQAVQAWYYPGFVDGHQFIYRGHRGLLASAAVSTSTISTPTTSEAVTIPPATEESSVMTAEANTNEMENKENMEQNESPKTEAPPQTSTTSDMPATTQPEKELPKTASTMPLFALIGMLLLGGALGLKMLASRVS